MQKRIFYSETKDATFTQLNYPNNQYVGYFSPLVYARMRGYLDSHDQHPET